MKIAVIVSDVTVAIHAGGQVETSVRTFDIPDEIADYITRWTGKCTTVSLAIVKDEIAAAPKLAGGSNVVE